ncbi:toxin-antitoxin system YwqK family antitoxin [Leptotrichia trevisanii]|uniref:toxin-antitoxin system YwqK family antitoxin n=1 Tax=Leptotrichia trevisanii TaxID=109328 RepID=UPI0012D2FA7D|nr:hypothetical protein [Leptotrichia trevisanii]
MGLVVYLVEVKEIKEVILNKKFFLFILLFFNIYLSLYAIKISEIEGTKILSNYDEIKDIEVERVFEKKTGTSVFNRVNGLAYPKNENKMFSGLLVSRSKGNTIVGLYQYKNGKGNGIGNDYYENGNLKSKSKMIDDETQGEVLFYYPSGRLERIGYYKKYNGIEIEEKDTEYYENGKIKSTLKAKDGLNAEMIGYYENGNKSYVMNVIQDYSVKGKINYLKNGESIAYEKNGNLWGILNFKNNSAYGLPQKLFKNGKLKYEFISAAEVGEKLETMTYFKEYFDKSDKLKLDCDEISSGEWHCKEYKKDGTLKNEFTSPTYKPKKDNSFWINAFLGIWNILF